MTCIWLSLIVFTLRVDHFVCSHGSRGLADNWGPVSPGSSLKPPFLNVQIATVYPTGGRHRGGASQTLWVRHCINCAGPHVCAR